jgi:hypothetical protein
MKEKLLLVGENFRKGCTLLQPAPGHSKARDRPCVQTERLNSTTKVGKWHNAYNQGKKEKNHQKKDKEA